eukprot:772732-Prymnesium_polylepis.1
MGPKVLPRKVSCGTGGDGGGDGAPAAMGGGWAARAVVCVPPWLGRVCQACHVFHTLYQCSHLIWGATSTPRYSTVLHGTPRYPTVPDGTR